MVENVFIEDMQLRGVEVIRNSPFTCYSHGANSEVEVEINDLGSGKTKTLRTQYLVGCDGARSNVRKSMLGADMVGEPGKAAWGVLDGEHKPTCLIC
jgi:phenol 2-monooxygenase